jgi:tetratricopeptide (TPR) repeat protein
VRARLKYLRPFWCERSQSFVLTLLAIAAFSLCPLSTRASAVSDPRQTLAASSGPKSEAAFTQLSDRAKQAWESGDFAHSARLFRQAVRLRPKSAESWGYLGSSLYQMKRFTEARDAYRETTKLTPGNGPSWAFLGISEYELHDYRHAFSDLWEGEQLGLGNDHDLQVIVRYRVALLWITAGEFDMGAKELAWFAQRNEANADIIQAFGTAILRIPLFPQDIPQTKKDLLAKAGEAAFAENSNELDQARMPYQVLVETYPREANVHYAYGRFLSKLDQDAAIREYEQELQVSPSHVQARIEAGYLHLIKGEFDKALSYAREAEVIAPRNALPHNLLGRILLAMAKPDDAVPELEEATRLAPNIVDFHLTLANAYRKAGQKELAEKEFAKFKELDAKRNEELVLQGKHQLRSQLGAGATP